MRKILVVIDMQNDFIDGSLGNKEAESIVDAVVDRIKEYDADDVFATMDTHNPDYLSTQEGTNLPVEHCIKGTPGWELNERIAPLIKPENIFEKPTFGSVDLAKKMAELNEKENLEIEILGLCTDICVVSNALLLKAFMPEVPVKVDCTCCAGVTPEKHNAALETMRSCQVAIIGE